jgi:hypothetical protein
LDVRSALRAAERHARTQRLAKQATQKGGAESNAAAREYREQQQEVLERTKAQREARLATKPLFEM